MGKEEIEGARMLSEFLFRLCHVWPNMKDIRVGRCQTT